jgi:hypothetical protein
MISSLPISNYSFYWGCIPQCHPLKIPPSYLPSTAAEIRSIWLYEASFCPWCGVRECRCGRGGVLISTQASIASNPVEVKTSPLADYCHDENRILSGAYLTGDAVTQREEHVTLPVETFEHTKVRFSVCVVQVGRAWSLANSTLWPLNLGSAVVGRACSRLVEFRQDSVRTAQHERSYHRSRQILR